MALLLSFMASSWCSSKAVSSVRRMICTTISIPLVSFEAMHFCVCMSVSVCVCVCVCVCVHIKMCCSGVLYHYMYMHVGAVLQIHVATCFENIIQERLIIAT